MPVTQYVNQKTLDLVAKANASKHISVVAKIDAEKSLKGKIKALFDYYIGVGSGG